MIQGIIFGVIIAGALLAFIYALSSKKPLEGRYASYHHDLVDSREFWK